VTVLPLEIPKTKYIQDGWNAKKNDMRANYKHKKASGKKISLSVSWS
jgi:hypothetical protein